MKKITIALSAHVDAGKTTLAEAILHACGAVRTPGRVDQGSSAFDTDSQEKARGITVFTGEASLSLPDWELNLLDTPGHVDFAAETERVLHAADLAVLVISGLDGVQPHTRTLWQLMERQGLPVVLFVSKMDTGRRTESGILSELRKDLSPACLPAHELLEAGEEAAMLKESLLDRYLEGGELTGSDIRDLVWDRDAFPVFFGSGLREEGIAPLLDFLKDIAPDWSLREQKPFGAFVYRISHDEKGMRRTHIKCVSGRTAPREDIALGAGKTPEKIAQILRPLGRRSRQETALSAGSIAVLTGLTAFGAGDILGTGPSGGSTFFEPALRYALRLPEGLAPEDAMPALRKIGEEEPALHLTYDPALGRIVTDLMGTIQGEILTELIRERFGWEVGLESGRILYKETVSRTVEGVGHFEPLRHYAEVHLALSPLPRGSGIVYEDADGGRTLPGDARRLILGQLAAKEHRGVLGGFPLTDVKISLLGGRLHEKHTEGGDFREAAWRAVRQGLMKAAALGACVLLEPYLAFEMTLPREKTGRALHEIRERLGEASREEETDSGFVRVSGRGPFRTFQNFAAELASFTGGMGRFKASPAGFERCLNQEDVIREAAYLPEADRENPPDSVFCRNGGGFSVPWQDVPSFMHLPYFLEQEAGKPAGGRAKEKRRQAPSGRRPHSGSAQDDELEAIMQREFGPIKRPAISGQIRRFAAPIRHEPGEYSGPTEYIIDGYNLIFAWEELKKLSEKGLDYAREQLTLRLQNFASFTGAQIRLVFDGYRVQGNPGSQEVRPPLEIIYTAENETADMRIEWMLAEREKTDRASVVSNDNLIRLSTIRQGGLRVSCEAFAAEYEAAMKKLSEMLSEEKPLGAAPVIHPAE